MTGGPGQSEAGQANAALSPGQDDTVTARPVNVLHLVYVQRRPQLIDHLKLLDVPYLDPGLEQDKKFEIVFTRGEGHPLDSAAASVDILALSRLHVPDVDITLSAASNDNIRLPAD